MTAAKCLVSVFAVTLVVGCSRHHSGDGSRPRAPTALSAVAADSQVTLTWPAVPGAASYNLYYATAPGVTIAGATKVAGVAGPHVQTGLANGTTYFFRVSAVNFFGESELSDEVSAAPLTLIFSGDLTSAGFFSTVTNVGQSRGDGQPAAQTVLSSAQFATGTTVGQPGVETPLDAPRSASYTTAITVK